MIQNDHEKRTSSVKTVLEDVEDLRVKVVSDVPDCLLVKLNHLSYYYLYLLLSLMGQDWEADLRKLQ